MSIKVVCGCGFCTLLPSEWEGKRVKCKCGRTFVVGRPDGLAQEPVVPPPSPRPQPAVPREPPAVPREPPAVLERELPAPLAAPATEPVVSPEPAVSPEPPPQAPDPELPAHSAPPAAEPPVSPEPPPVPTAEHVGLDRPAPVTNTLHRGMHTSRVRPQAMLACITMLLALVSLTALFLVLHDNNWSIAAMLGREAPPDGVEPPAAGSEADPLTPDGSNAGTGRTPARADGAAKGTQDGSSDKGTTAARLANLTELVSDDGLLLSGLFGEGTDRLELNATQQETIAQVVQRLHENEEALKAKGLTLEQWYAACHKLGDELLAVLTDAQRQQFRGILERKEMERVHLVEYAARFVPELAVALMPWSAQVAGRSFDVITESSLTAPAPGRCCRPAEPTGMLATLTAAGAADAPASLTVWDLVKNRQGSRVEITSPITETTSLLSRDGRHLVLVHAMENAARTVEVWSAEAGKLVDRKELPAARSGQYTVRDCVAHRVVALAGQSYWVWDYESGESHEIDFPESRPDAAPCLAVSVDGGQLVVAHPHLIAGAPDERCMVEVCIYRLDTGELLGNQVFHKDYQRSTIGAIALSHDGRELALLWDFGPDNPTRRLVHMNARSGKIIKIVDGLPAADQGYARQHQLPDRDLVWLSENSGWVVNLQNVVDAETAAVLPLELPAEVGGSGNAAREIVEIVPAGDGRLLLVIADRPATPDPKATMNTLFVDLPKLGPFQ